MKKIFTVVIFCLATSFIFAHDINYEKVILRNWSIEKENRFIEGSFYMYKKDMVYIEDINSNIISIPLSKLSDTDKAFVLQKSNKIAQFNQSTPSIVSSKLTWQALFNFQFWLVGFSLLGFAVYIFNFTEKKKLKYLIPILAVGLSVTLYSFTTKAIKILPPLFSPAFIDSAFIPFKPNVHTFWDNAYFYVDSKGIPTTHDMMVGISSRGWQQQVPIPQCYIGSNAWSIPLSPVMSSNPIPVDSIHFTRGAIALAVNGVPIFNVHTNTGVDSYLDGQLDNFGGHCGRADDYHYHIAPLHLYSYTSTSLPIAFGLDGYPVYGNVEPDGTPMQSLDANHGHLFKGLYHYHGTASAPYMIARMAGQVTEDATHQLIPQAAARPVRPSLTPLSGALITSCIPNATGNGYNLAYTRNGIKDSVVYNWSTSGVYTFKFYTSGHLDSTKNYNGFLQCTLPISTGIKEYSNPEEDFVIFPNPTKGIFQIQLKNNILQKDVKEISIFNLQGKIIYQTKQFSPTIELKNVPKGIYLIHIELPQKHLTHKLIIQ